MERELLQAKRSPEVQASGLDEDGDDIKCSICQREFGLGDEIGASVECEHGYHAMSIYQWLRLNELVPHLQSCCSPIRIIFLVKQSPSVNNYFLYFIGLLAISRHLVKTV